MNRNVKNISVFLSENFQFLEVIFSIYFNRRNEKTIVWTNGSILTSAWPSEVPEQRLQWSPLSSFFYSPSDSRPEQNIPLNADTITKTSLFKYTENFTTKKNENFQIKNSDIFLISALNMDCGYSLEPPRRGGSNEYPQSMLLSRNKKNNVYPCKPQFYYRKVGLRGSKLYRYVFVMSFRLQTFTLSASVFYLVPEKYT